MLLCVIINEKVQRQNTENSETVNVYLPTFCLGKISGLKFQNLAKSYKCSGSRQEDPYLQMHRIFTGELQIFRNLRRLF